MPEIVIFDVEELAKKSDHGVPSDYDRRVKLLTEALSGRLTIDLDLIMAEAEAEGGNPDAHSEVHCFLNKIQEELMRAMRAVSGISYARGYTRAQDKTPGSD